MKSSQGNIDDRSEYLSYWMQMNAQIRWRNEVEAAVKVNVVGSIMMIAENSKSSEEQPQESYIVWIYDVA